MKGNRQYIYRSHFTAEELKYGLVVFRSVSEMAVCHSSDEAVAAINSFVPGSFGENHRADIEKMFNGEDVPDKSSYGYTYYLGRGYITICPAFGATVEEHQKEYLKRHGK